jgi:predicted P-loop ATPase
VEDGALVRAIGRRWLIQAVARAMQPGCQADAVLVLIGEQGQASRRSLLSLKLGALGPTLPW